jgi:hypothetical protein
MSIQNKRARAEIFALPPSTRFAAKSPTVPTGRRWVGAVYLAPVNI